MAQVVKIVKTDNGSYLVEGDKRLNSYQTIDEALEYLLHEFEQRTYDTGAIKIGRGKDEVNALRRWKHQPAEKGEK